MRAVKLQPKWKFQKMGIHTSRSMLITSTLPTTFHCAFYLSRTSSTFTEESLPLRPIDVCWRHVSDPLHLRFALEFLVAHFFERCPRESLRCGRRGFPAAEEALLMLSSLSYNQTDSQPWAPARGSLHSFLYTSGSGLGCVR